MKTSRLVAISMSVSALGCIRAPDIVTTDRGTVLEQQAGGSYADLEKQLNRKSIEARPVPLTPKQLQALGIEPLPVADRTERTDADRVDALLEQHCIGEGREGLLVDTHRDCRGASNRAEALELVDRVNQARQQLWRWMQEQKTDTSIAELRRRWREAHVEGIVCGGWLEDDGGHWDAKKC